MNTAKLFYENCHLLDFTATVTGCERAEKGYLVTLSATAFYPEGGGQACDLGTLGSANVLDVRERGEAICHLCDRPLEVGAVVEGHVDAARRLDLQQQHSGEHIVSGIICKQYNCHNVGFHVGKEAMEIDFDAPIPPEALPQIELEANRAIWQNLPIRAWYPSPEQLPAIPYRSKKALDWPVRIVEIPGYDCCACCGVHVAATGEIGLIKLLSCVKLRQGVRIEMVCGARAVGLMQEIFAQNLQVSQAFSAKIRETGPAAQKMNEALAAQKLRANCLQSRVFDFIAEKFDGAGKACHFEENLSGAQLRELAEKLADHCGGWAAAVTAAEAGCNICIIGGDIKALTDALKAAFPTRGGGKPGSFQGSVAADQKALLAFLKDM